MKTTLTQASEHPFLSALNPEERDVITHNARERVYEPGEIIFRQGEPANQFYLLLSGAVDVQAREGGGSPLLVQSLQAGDVLGWSWLFAPFAWHFEAKAVEPTRLMIMDGARLLVACEEDPDLGYDLMKQIAPIIINRLQSARRQLLEAPGVADLPFHPVARASGLGPWNGEPLAEMIRRHPFGRGLHPSFLNELEKVALAVEFAPGESIFREGDIANRFYLIHSGKVALEVARFEERPVVALQVIEGGDVLGWSWLFPPYYWHFDARALTPVKGIFFYGTRLREACEQNHKLGCELMKRMIKIIIQRLQSTRRQLVAARSHTSTAIPYRG